MRNLSPASRQAESPERRVRMEERRHLSTLNARLENYIMTIREREAELAERNVEHEYVHITEHEQSVSSLRKDYEARIQKLHEQLNKANVNLEDLQRKLDREIKKNDDLQRTIRQLEQSREDIQQRIVALSHELQTLKVKSDKDESKILALANQIDALKKNESDIKRELEQLRDEYRKNLAALDKEKDLRTTAQEELKIMSAEWEKERKNLIARIEALSGDAEDIERQIRSQLIKNMQEQLERIQKELQNSHDQVLKHIRDDFNEQLQQLRNRDSELAAERDKLRLTVEQLQRSGADIDKLKSQHEREIRDLDRKLAELQSKLDAAYKDHNQEIADKSKEIARLSDLLRKVESERNLLFGLGVGLKKAVETYEQIIVKEEDLIRNGRDKKQRVSESVSISSTTTIAKESPSTYKKTVDIDIEVTPDKGRPLSKAGSKRKSLA